MRGDKRFGFSIIFKLNSFRLDILAIFIRLTRIRTTKLKRFTRVFFVLIAKQAEFHKLVLV